VPYFSLVGIPILFYIFYTTSIIGCPENTSLADEWINTLDGELETLAAVRQTQQ
jgi:hypothetical protein